MAAPRHRGGERGATEWRTRRRDQDACAGRVAMRIGIVGGGFTGLVLEQRLATEGHAGTVFAREKQLRGLATDHDYRPFVWDGLYHCILPSDTHLIGFLNDIGVGDW